MIIYRDIFDQNQEFLSDCGFIFEDVEGFLLKTQAKLIDKPKENEDFNIGANPSEQECDDEQQAGGGQDTNEKCIDVCHLYRLKESDILNEPKIIKKFVQHYMAAIPKKLDEDEETKGKGKGDEFKALCKSKGNKILTKIFKEGGDNLTALVGENFCFPEERVENDKKVWDITHGIVLACWNEDGMGLTLYLFKHGLIEEKA